MESFDEYIKRTMSEQENLAPRESDWLEAERLLDAAFERKKRRRAFAFWLFAGCAAVGFLAFWLLKTEVDEAVLASSAGQKRVDSTVQKQAADDSIFGKDSLDRMRVFAFRDSLLADSDRKKEAENAAANSPRFQSGDQKDGSKKVADHFNGQSKRLKPLAEKGAIVEAPRLKSGAKKADFSAEKTAQKAVGEEVKNGHEFAFEDSILQAIENANSLRLPIKKEAEKGQILDQKKVFAVAFLPLLEQRFLPGLTRKTPRLPLFDSIQIARKPLSEDDQKFRGGSFVSYLIGKPDSFNHLKMLHFGLWGEQKITSRLSFVGRAGWQIVSGLGAEIQTVESTKFRFGFEQKESVIKYQKWHFANAGGLLSYRFFEKIHMESGVSLSIPLFTEVSVKTEVTNQFREVISSDFQEGRWDAVKLKLPMYWLHFGIRADVYRGLKIGLRWDHNLSGFLIDPTASKVPRYKTKNLFGAEAVFTFKNKKKQ